MTIAKIVATIEEEIARLKQARAILAGEDEPVAQSAPGKRGPKPGTKLSVEAKARMAVAQKKRWAAQKRS